MRRRGLLGAAPAALLSPPLAFAQPVVGADGASEPTAAERGAMAQLARAFMQKYDVPGLSIAIGRGGKIAYRGAFGEADREQRETLTPAHLFRIASISKTLTSVAIFVLIEQGRLRLSDRVFGPGAILGIDYGRPREPSQVGQITVDHLLTHTAGGWSNDRTDPMFSNPDLNQAQLIEWTLRNRPLEHVPGQFMAYSNFGYCVLGRVIERVTGETYARHVGAAVLARCGVSDMAIAGNTLAERRHGEVRYYGLRDSPYGMNVTRMDSHGGWIARPEDVVRLFMHVSGFAQPPNILRPETIATMTTDSPAKLHYAKGWYVNEAGNWWHTGSLPGTATIAVRTHSGFCWAVFLNTRQKESTLHRDLDNLAWQMARQVKTWRV